MQIEITFLGTSAATPTKERSLPSVLLEFNGYRMLFDCGEGTQRQLMLAGKSIHVDYVFITHVHADHVAGLLGLVNSLTLNRRTVPLYIYAPRSAVKYLRRLVFSIPVRLPFPIVWKGIDKEGVILETKQFKVEAVKLEHTTDAYGYVFIEKDRRKLNVEKLEKTGIKDFYIYRALKEGKTVEFNGKVLHPEDFTFIVKGRSVAYITDTRPVFCRKVDLLIHEATFTEREKEIAQERGHSTAKEVALLAKKCGIKRVVLFHISPRYRKGDELLAEAKSVYENVVIAEDLMTIKL